MPDRRAREQETVALLSVGATIFAMDLCWGERAVIDAAGVSIHVERAGAAADDGTGPVIAGLHGFASGTFTWAGVAPRLTDRWPVVAWDRPPFGRSERPPVRRGQPDPYAEPRVLEQAEAVLRALAPDRPVVLVGHSAGTVVATALARAESIDIVGVVLIAPALDGAPPAIVGRLASLPGASALGSRALRLAVRGAAPAIRHAGRHRTPLLDATADETARTLRRPGTAEGLWHLTSTWSPPPPLDELQPLGVPTMVIGGADDRISSPSSTEVVAERLGADLHVLDGVGHAAHEQVPVVVADLVAGFVAESAEGLGGERDK